jgi:CheY-like chemotaxis protein
VNLVGNAIKFTERGGVTLRVSCDPVGERFRCEVIDTGIGLADESLVRLFEAFEQADTSTTRRFGGTGLGLRISKRLAQMLGGDIGVQSELGKGSVFTLEVATGSLAGVSFEDAAARRSDMGTDSRVAAHAPVLPAQPLGGVRILLAEDGADNVRLITHHLRKAGATVTAVGNGRLAVEALTSDGSVDGPLRPDAPFDLVLSDMQMPEMDGYEATRTLRSKGCTLPIIALTAHAMSGDLDRCTAAGCDGYATKPIDREHLIQVCRQAAAREAGFYRRAA